MKSISHKERSDMIVQIMVDYQPITDLLIEENKSLDSVYHTILKDFAKRQDTEYFKQFYTIPFLNFATFKLRLFDEISFKYDISSIKPKFINEAIKILSDNNSFNAIEKQFNRRLIDDLENVVLDFQFYNDLYRLALYCENHFTLFEINFSDRF